MSALDAARLLWTHWQSGTTLDALPTPLRPTTRADGYAVQACLPTVSGRTVVGWKIAATSAAGQQHIGVSGPLAGCILSGHVHTDGAEISLAGNRMRVVEPEFAFRMGRSLEPKPTPYDVVDVFDAVRSLQPALELPDSRYADFARAGEAQLLADDACARHFVLGAEVGEGWRAIDLRMHRVRGLARRGNGDELAREGDGSAVLGDPRVALVWLVNELSSLGITLEAGQFVSTGVCMTPLEVQPGDRVEADFGALGRVSVRLSR